MEICRRYSRTLTMIDPNFPNYKSGTNGPIESDLLLSRDGNHWWDDIQ